VKYLSLAEALFIASEITGTSANTLARISRVDLLDSALAVPASSFDGEEFYPNIFDKAAVLGSRIVRNHPLHDGNKRLAWSSVVIFLDLNGVNLQVSDDDAVSTILNLAADSLGEKDFSSWLQGNSTLKGV